MILPIKAMYVSFNYQRIDYEHEHVLSKKIYRTRSFINILYIDRMHMPAVIYACGQKEI